jgi:hypothetical protein
MQQLKYLTVLFILAALLVAAGGAVASPGAVAPNLRSAASFVGLAFSTFTNTGPGVFVGNVGTSPGTSITGFPPGTIKHGTMYMGGPVPAQAQIDASLAYNDLKGRSCDVNLTGQDLGVMAAPLPPKVYCFDTSAQLTGQLVLDALGDPDAVWVFQMGSTLTTGPGSSVALINSGTAFLPPVNARAPNVFWQVGSSATLDTGTRFRGNILADQSITLVAGAGLMGRALALHGAVTMDTNGAPFPIANTPLFEFLYVPFIAR